MVGQSEAAFTSQKHLLGGKSKGNAPSRPVWESAADRAEGQDAAHLPALSSHTSENKAAQETEEIFTHLKDYQTACFLATVKRGSAAVPTGCAQRCEALSGAQPGPAVTLPHSSLLLGK